MPVIAAFVSKCYGPKTVTRYYFIPDELGAAPDDRLLESSAAREPFRTSDDILILRQGLERFRTDSEE